MEPWCVSDSTLLICVKPSMWWLPLRLLVLALQTGVHFCTSNSGVASLRHPFRHFEYFRFVLVMDDHVDWTIGYQIRSSQITALVNGPWVSEWRKVVVWIKFCTKFLASIFTINGKSHIPAVVGWKGYCWKDMTINSWKESFDWFQLLTLREDIEYLQLHIHTIVRTWEWPTASTEPLLARRKDISKSCLLLLVGSNRSIVYAAHEWTCMGYDKWTSDSLISKDFLRGDGETNGSCVWVGWLRWTWVEPERESQEASALLNPFIYQWLSSKWSSTMAPVSRLW